MIIKKDTTIEFKKNNEWYRADVVDLQEENVLLHTFATQPTNAWRYFNSPNIELVKISEIKEVIEIEKGTV